MVSSSISTTVMSAAHLLESNNFFDDLVNTFPPSLYITEKTSEEEEALSSKYKKGLNKENKMSKKNDNKREKFAMAKEESVTTAVKEKREREWDEENRNGGDDGESSDDDDDNDDERSNSKMDVDEDEEDSDNDSADNDVDESADFIEDNKVPAEDRKILKSSAATSAASDSTISRIEILRMKLQQKINQNLPKQNSAGENGGISKRAARKADKMKKIVAAKAANGDTSKILTKEEKKIKEAERKKSTGGHSNAEKVTKTYNKSSDLSEANVPVTDDLSGIDFGSIQGLKPQSTNYLDKNKSLAKVNGKGKKSLDSLLAEAEAKKARLKELKSDDKEKYDKIVWGDALKQANGEIVRSDPEKIKKAIKRREKEKGKSKKKWDDRIETLAGEMTEKQDIRKQNIELRKKGGSAGANLTNKRLMDDKDKEKASIDQEEEGGEKKRARLGPHSLKGKADLEKEAEKKGAEREKEHKAQGKGGGDGLGGKAGFEGKKRGFINKSK